MKRQRLQQCISVRVGLPINTGMYIIYGFYPDGRSARLEYPAGEAGLGQALSKLRDWVEADEIDDNGPMFKGYALTIDPLPNPGGRESGGRDHDADAHADVRKDWPPLKLA